MPPTTPTNLLSLPVEVRLHIYDYVLSSSSIHSFRPHRKIGWNRPHADLTNPALLFESDAPLALRQLFHSKLTKNDHALILKTVLNRIKILIVDHTDYTILLKIANVPNAALSASSAPARSSLVAVVKENLRTIDFSDRMDEIVCQPNDIVKLIRGLPGLRAVHLTSKHVQRYSGTIEDHVEFARERADREIAKLQMQKETSDSTESTATRSSGDTNTENTAAELRRLSLRSPMTDGTRMMISPAMFNRSLPVPRSSRNNSGTNRSSTVTDTTWVVVDLSMIVWQHFLYTGAPYRDHWRTIRMSALIEIAEKHNVHIVMNFRNVSFDPPKTGSGYWCMFPSGSTRQRFQRLHLPGGIFKGEMSTSDWVLRLRMIGRASGPEYVVNQRKAFDELVAQANCGMVRCRHSSGKRAIVCDECSSSISTNEEEV